ncbi:MAG: hypothetical protein NC412_02230 [Roseburia sp.]|nr:hypothetical protein [Roseburia sp.]MCM1278059.1 hypothetical protein [Robinsoniella sp.]
MFHKISGVLEAIRKKRYQNEGSSLIMVIIMVSFVGVLVSISVYASYYNFYMKYNDRSAKNSFYTVETALDEINVGLQREISLSMAECYTAVSRQSNLSVQQKEDEFKTSFYKSLWEKLRYKQPGSSGTNSQLYRVDKLTLYLDKTRYDSSKDVGALVLTKQDGSDPDLIPALNTRIGNTEVAYQPGNGDMLILKNVSLQYRDLRGYVSMLTTDIVIKIPTVSFVSTKQMPDIENYCLIANELLEVKNGNTQTTINGSVYGGGKIGTIIDNRRSLRVGDETTGQERKYIAKQVTVGKDGAGSGLTTLPGTQLWTEAIDVFSANNVSLQDKTYVKDDLTIEGRNSRITLGGEYYGYGSGSVQAEDSSSILINGANTTLDMSQLNNLMLMGHAFVGARHYDANVASGSDYVDTINPSPDPSDPYLNSSDFMLGQSVAVKGDQMMYMVPEECMGYEGNVQVLPKNPMTIAEHTMLTTTVQTDASGATITDAAGNALLKYSVVRLDKVFEKLGKSVNAYGASYRPVYRRVDGTVMVYYYLYFNSESMANEFFSDYYAADKEALDAYIKKYVAEFSWNEALGTRNASGVVNSPLHIAGNLVYFDNNGTGNAVLKRDTKTEDLNNIASLNSSIDVIKDSHQALFAKLLLNIENVASSELTNPVDGSLRTAYENIVLGDDAFGDDVASGTEQFGDIVPAGTTMICTNSGTGVDPADEVNAMIVNNYNGSPFEITDSNADKLYFVVASGDVRVTAREFKGVILARGTITVEPSCDSFIAVPDKVKAAMSCRDQNDLVNGHFAADILIDGASYLNYTAANDTNTTPSNEYGYMELADLIYYENWNKK